MVYKEWMRVQIPPATFILKTPKGVFFDLKFSEY